MSNPWTFGWTQLLTLLGFILTATIALGGFRSFEQWRREKVEEVRITVAFETLALAYEAKHIFGQIRSSIAYEYEWIEMAPLPGETVEERQQRGSYYAVLNRISAHSPFFDRVWKVQPKFMACFGENSEEIFNHFHEARALLLLAGRALTYDLPITPKVRSEDDYNLRVKYRSDLWGDGSADRVDGAVRSFRDGIEKLSRAAIERKYRRFWRRS
jgi:hypothetical protein